MSWGGSPGCRSGRRQQRGGAPGAPLAVAISCSLCDSRGSRGPGTGAGAEPRRGAGRGRGRGQARRPAARGPPEHPAPRRGAQRYPQAAPLDLPPTQVSCARRPGCRGGRRGDRDAAGDGDAAVGVREGPAPLFLDRGGRSARCPDYRGLGPPKAPGGWA